MGTNLRFDLVAEDLLSNGLRLSGKCYTYVDESYYDRSYDERSGGLC